MLDSILAVRGQEVHTIVTVASGILATHGSLGVQVIEGPKITEDQLDRAMNRIAQNVYILVDLLIQNRSVEERASIHKDLLALAHKDATSLRTIAGTT